MASERLRRLFVAVLLPPEVEAELEALEKRLKQQVQAPLKWVRPEAIHLTLKFLGAFPDSRLADLKGALQAVAEGFQQAPFSLQLGPLGTFGARGQVNVLWVGVEGALAPLAELARAIDKAQGPAGAICGGFPCSAEAGRFHGKLFRPDGEPSGAPGRTLRGTGSLSIGIAKPCSARYN